MILESTSNPWVTLAGDKASESAKLNLNLDQSIFLVGGYDGVSWSSTLDYFSPSHDVLRSIKPMSYVRAHASVAKLGGELYVLGGASGPVWCDTGIAFASPSLYSLSSSLIVLFCLKLNHIVL